MSKKKSLMKNILLVLTAFILVPLVATNVVNASDGKFIPLKGGEFDFDRPPILLNENEILFAGGRVSDPIRELTSYGSVSITPRDKEVPAKIFNTKTQTFHEVKPNFVVPANDFSYVKLNDGRFLLAGAGEFAKIFDPKTMALKNIEGDKLKLFRTPQCFLLSDGRVFIISDNIMEMFDPRTNIIKSIGEKKEFEDLFTKKAGLPEANYKRIYNTMNYYDNSRSALFYNDKVLIIGSYLQYEGTLTIAKAEIYNIKSNKSSYLELPKDIKYVDTITTLKDGRILITCSKGDNFDGVVYMAKIFDPKTNEFKTIKTFAKQKPVKISYCNSILLENGEVLLIKGEYKRTEVLALKTLAEVFNPKTNTIRRIAKPSDVKGLKVQLIDLRNRQIFFTGGGKANIYKY